MAFADLVNLENKKLLPPWIIINVHRIYRRLEICVIAWIYILIYLAWHSLLPFKRILH